TSGKNVLISATVPCATDRNESTYEIASCCAISLRLGSLRRWVQLQEWIGPTRSIRYVHTGDVECFGNGNFGWESWPVPTGLWSRHLSSDVCFQSMQRDNPGRYVFSAGASLLYRQQ